jgi:hypothetical protein
MRTNLDLPLLGATSHDGHAIAMPWRPDADRAATWAYDPGCAQLARDIAETWSAVEDVWLRLHACTEVRVSMDALPTLRFKEFKTRVRGPLRDLRAAALDAALYFSQEGSRRGSIVHTIEIDGNDLVLMVTQLTLIRRWPGGPEIA